jgi:CHAT domain-containing protein
MCLAIWTAWPRITLWAATRDINRIYANYRLFPYRWIGAPYGPIRPNLTASEIKQLQDDLANVELQIAGVRNRLESSSRPGQLIGRVELLRGRLGSFHFDKAISEYKLALLLSPDDAEIKLELGIALVARAEHDSQALQFEAALQQMLEAGRSLTAPEVSFDSAILFAKFPMPLQAQSQWELASEREISPPWRDETVREMSKLKNILQRREAIFSALTSSPESFLSATNEKDASEVALHTAEVQWLPQNHTTAALTGALQQLSSLLISQHHDSWLKDMLAKPISPREVSGLENLAGAIRLNEKGEHRRAEQMAVSAEKTFQQSYNMAGELRARLEQVYSFDRRANYRDCLRTLQHLETPALSHQYLWIAAQARLEHVTCSTLTRQEDVISVREMAYEWVKGTGYEGLTLRALGFLAEDYVSADSRLKLWQRGRNGLILFWQRPLPALRGYSFYYSLAFDARKSGHPEAAIALLKEGTLLLKDSGTIAIRALLLSDLSAWETEAGMTDAATATLAEKDQEFAKIAPDEAAGFRRESTLTLARELISIGHPSDALRQIQRITKGMPWPYKNFDDNVRRTLLPTLGNAYLRLNDLPSACTNDLQAISEGLDRLVTVQNPAQRDNALHQADSAWRGLTEINVRLGRQEEALYVWELYRSGRNKSSDLKLQSLPTCFATASQQPHPDLPIGTSVLVYAFLHGGLSAWIANSSGVEQVWIDANQARRLAVNFTQLVADPHSPMATVSKVGRELYSQLIGPLVKNMPKQGVLFIDCEGELAGIPWAALEDANQHPLVERFALAQSIGVPDLYQHRPEPAVDLKKTLIFGSPGLGDDLAGDYPPIISASAEASEVHRRLPDSLLLNQEDATADAFKLYAPASTHFHFAGHGISYGGFGALLVASKSRSVSSHYLTAEEISGLDLSGLRTVVLAACSSGMGEQSGVVNLDSLTGAFLEAGASRVVAASWDVDDFNTTILMSSFYKGLTDGLNAAEALRRAELSVRSKSYHPYFWAGFQVFGAP